MRGGIRGLDEMRFLLVTGFIKLYPAYDTSWLQGILFQLTVSLTPHEEVSGPQ